MLGSYETNHIYNTDALTLLSGLPDNCINACITSPPYFHARDYGIDEQIGREPTVQAYVEALVGVFRELRRVLSDTGSLWLNLGDSYSQGGRGSSEHHRSKLGKKTAIGQALGPHSTPGYGEKQLLMIPARVAIALQDDGWILRSEIIWDKGNPLPESVKDRPTRAHEQIYLLTKCPRYFYDADAIKTPVKKSSIKRLGRAVPDQHKHHKGAPGQTPHSMFRARPHAKQDGTGNRRYTGFNERYDGPGTPMANARSVWHIHPKGFKGAHYATFPPALAERMILAGCPVGGVVLDCFFGAGTVGLVAQRLGRQWLGSEINAEYCELARARIAGRLEEYQAKQAGEYFTLPMFEALP